MFVTEISPHLFGSAQPLVAWGAAGCMQWWQDLDPAVSHVKSMGVTWGVGEEREWEHHGTSLAYEMRFGLGHTTTYPMAMGTDEYNSGYCQTSPLKIPRLSSDTVRLQSKKWHLETWRDVPSTIPWGSQVADSRAPRALRLPKGHWPKISRVLLIHIVPSNTNHYWIMIDFFLIDLFNYIIISVGWLCWIWC